MGELGPYVEKCCKPESKGCNFLNLTSNMLEFPHSPSIHGYSK